MGSFVGYTRWLIRGGDLEIPFEVANVKISVRFSPQGLPTWMRLKSIMERYALLDPTFFTL